MNIPNFGNENFSPTEFREIMRKFFDKYSYNVEVEAKRKKTPTWKLQPQQKLVPMYANFKRNQTPGHGSILIMHALGSGKCHEKGTPIIKSDGSVIKVEDIMVGDQLMGDDSKPRRVLSLARGRDTMYQVVPVKGDSYTFNSEHILCVVPSPMGYGYRVDKRRKNQKKKWAVNFINPKTVTTNSRWFATEEEAKEFFEKKCREDNTINISIKDYLKLPKHTQNQLKLYRIPVEFPTREVPMDPYIIGMWLGDGNSASPGITNQDSAVIKYLAKTLPKYNCYIKFHPSQNCYHYRINTTIDANYFWKTIKELNLKNNKHIPDLYKMNSREVRLGVLAGLIDSDGHYSKSCFEFTQKNERLMDDVIYVARSLGFSAYKSIKKTSWTHQGVKKYSTAWRCTISGDLDQIPTKIERKKATIRGQKKNVLVTGFKVVEKPVDNYYGFTLDGNHRFLLGDFTVSHNSCSSIVIGEAYRAFLLERARIGDKKRKIIYVAPNAVQENIIETIGGTITLVEDKYGEKYYAQTTSHCETAITDFFEEEDIIRAFGARKAREVARQDVEAALDKQRKGIARMQKKMVQRDWEILGFIKFANSIYFKRTGGLQGLKIDTMSELGRLLYEGGNLIIIDEVQNTISSTEGITYEKVQRILNLYSKNNLVVLMSATPIYDKPIELGLTLNLLNPRIYFPKKMFYEYFFPRTLNHKGELTGPRKIINKNLFKWLCTGYVSYFSGGDPLEFPKKRIINLNHKMTPQQYITYRSNLLRELGELNILKFFNNDDDNTEFGELLAVFKGPQKYSNIGYQNIIYDSVSCKEVKNHSCKAKWIIQTLDPKNKRPQQGFGQTRADSDSSSIGSDDVIDDISDVSSVDESEEVQESPVGGKTVKKKSEIKQHEIPSWYFEGKVLIFSEYKQYGIWMFCKLLNGLGYKDATKDKELNRNKKALRYIVWSGDTDTKKIKPYVNLFNSPKNEKGDYIKVVLGTGAIKEGVSFKSIRTVHIMEPWWNESRIEQVIARAIRFRSHSRLPESERYVNVFRHHAVLPDYPGSQKDLDIRMNKEEQNQVNAIKKLNLHRYSMDTYVRIKAENKLNNRREFELLLKQSAIDCNQFSAGNNIRIVEHIFPEEDKYIVYYENPSTSYTYIVSTEPVLFVDLDFNSPPCPEKYDLSKVNIEYDKFSNKFGNKIKITIMGGKMSLGSKTKGVINEGILCDNDLKLDSDERRVFNILLEKTRQIKKMRKILDYIYKDESKLNYYKKNIVECLINCQTKKENTKLYNYLFADGKIKEIEIKHLDDDTKGLYDKLRKDDRYKTLIGYKVKGKGKKGQNILKLLCIDPDNLDAIEANTSLKPGMGQNELPYIINEVRYRIKANMAQELF